MDGFSYHNIFATKGIEYIAIITFLLLLIPFWILLNRRIKSVNLRNKLGALTSRILKVPQGLFFSSNHTWTYLEKSGTARVGLDDLVLHITGEVNIRHLRKEGEEIKKGDLLAEIDKNGKNLRIYSPISGTIQDGNEILNENPDLLLGDPYGTGWIYKIKPSSWISETKSCYLAEKASEWSDSELLRFRDFVAESLKKYSPEPAFAVLQDGGELRDNTLSGLPDEIWNDFQDTFLKIPD